MIEITKHSEIIKSLMKHPDKDMIMPFFKSDDVNGITVFTKQKNILNFMETGEDIFDEIRIVVKGKDIVNKFLYKKSPCWCCGRLRLSLWGLDENSLCIGKIVDKPCKYFGKKGCKPDGNCGGKDCFKEKHKSSEILL